MSSEGLGYDLEDLTHLVSLSCAVRAGAMVIKSETKPDMFLDKDSIRLCRSRLVSCAWTSCASSEDAVYKRHAWTAVVEARSRMLARGTSLERCHCREHGKEPR